MTMSESELPCVVRDALEALVDHQNHQPLAYEPISGVGENAYGQLLRVSWPQHTVVVKIAPQNEARRAHMHVVDFYAREVFMYRSVFRAYNQMEQLRVTPALKASGLEAPHEFLIFEDLTQQNFVQNERSCMPTYDLVNCSLKALAELHGSSFALQHKQAPTFTELVAQIKDNLFTPTIETVTIEFGKAQIRRGRKLLEQDSKEQEMKEDLSLMLDIMERCEERLKALALHCVDGERQSPYAVICHGDFWNNNILYKHEPTTGLAIEAKLIDFQMSRYAPPVLDLVHYLFACTEKQLRDTHFTSFLNTYYDTLSKKLTSYDLQPEHVYPRHVFDQQLRDFGVYGFIMASFSLPFFISQANEIVNIDEVSEAIQDLSTESDDAPKCRELVEEFDMLNERTLPIFKRRLIDIVRDLIKYEMTETLFKTEL